MGRQALILANVVAGILLIALAGCGPGRGKLSGTVTFQGKPLRFGTVLVLGGDGIPKSGQIEDGGFTANDIQPGPVKVAVTSPDPANSSPVQRFANVPAPTIDRTGWFAIPETYGDFEKSGLTFPLKRGTNVWDIDLK